MILPQLTIRGIDPERVISISEKMVQQLADVCGCGTDNFTVDCLQTVSVMDGKRVDTFPFVEVAWFERGPQTRDRIADTITNHFLLAGVPEMEIAFKVYTEDVYYINGVRFDS
jgi:hypothetical protein